MQLAFTLLYRNCRLCRLTCSCALRTLIFWIRLYGTDVPSCVSLHGRLNIEMIDARYLPLLVFLLSFPSHFSRGKPIVHVQYRYLKAHARLHRMKIFFANSLRVACDIVRFSCFSNEL